MSQIKGPIVFIIGLLLGAGAAWWIEGLRWSTNVATIQAANSADMKLIANTAQAATNDALTKQKAAETALAAVDAKYTQELADAKQTNDSLRASVAAGSTVLRVKAVCPASSGTASSGTVSNGTGSAGVGDAAGARLEGDAQQDYYTLLDQLTLMDAQLSACQAYAHAISLSKGAASE